MSADFFSKINYSAANEDGESERRALSGGLEGGSGIVITGSGSRALELLISKPARLVSIDFNPTQSFLLELKVSAIKKLEYDEFLKFIGVNPSDERKKTYRLIRNEISTEARAFWDQHQQEIIAGVLYCGSWEKYLGAIATAGSIFRGRLIQKLLNTPDLESQKKFWEDEWKNATWKLSLKALGVRALWKYVAKEPGIDRVPKEMDISKEIGDRLDMAAHHLHLKNCHFAWLILTGKYSPSDCLPCHLEREHYQTIKDHLNILEVETGAIDNYLANSTDKFSAYSISDFGSYAPPEIYERIWQSIQRTAEPGRARVNEREFLVPQSPEGIDGIHFQRNTELENKLAKSDRALIYKFITGVVH